MNLTHFFDVKVHGDSESSAPEAFSLAIKLFHMANTMRSFAVAFPDMKGNKVGPRLRVLSDSKEQLQELASHAKNRGLTEAMKFAPVLDIPDYETVEFFKHFRTQSENKKYHPGKKPTDDYFDQQYVRLKEMPYIWMSSQSGKQKFRAYVERIQILGIGMVAGEPNSYGLSSTRNMIAIPVF
jgi:CRISPR-associated endoribonuclease Cas6/Csy4 subtype I-F